jgi:hypothetical protein
MDRARFEYLLEAYGANFGRWPLDERAAAEAFAREHDLELASLLGEARALDQALDFARPSATPSEMLSRRILAAAPQARPAPRRQSFAPAGWALAACTLLGVLIGYGGGALAPSADQDDYFAAAFAAPLAISDAGDPG